MIVKRFLIIMCVFTVLLIGCGRKNDSEDNTTVEETTDLSTYVFGKEVAVGDVVMFGAYEQDAKTDNGTEAVEWIVLDVKEDKALIISKECLDVRTYHDTYVDVTWADSEVRSWLNGEFLNALLTAEEQGYVATTKVTTPDNEDFATIGGEDTEDKVFLLSLDESDTYFVNNIERVASPTKYAVSKGAYESKEGTTWWWLRSPGETQRDAADVYTDGSIMRDGYFATNRIFSIRPAMWVNIYKW